MAPPMFPQVERPGSDRLALVAALIETGRTGRAIHVPLHGRSVMAVRQSLYNPLKRRGYRLRLVRDGAAWARAWVETPNGRPRKRRTT